MMTTRFLIVTTTTLTSDVGGRGIVWNVRIGWGSSLYYLILPSGATWVQPVSQANDVSRWYVISYIVSGAPAAP